jgi:hypothetical protein
VEIPGVLTNLYYNGVKFRLSDYREDLYLRFFSYGYTFRFMIQYKEMRFWPYRIDQTEKLIESIARYEPFMMMMLPFISVMSMRLNQHRLFDLLQEHFPRTEEKRAYNILRSAFMSMCCRRSGAETLKYAQFLKPHIQLIRDKFHGDEEILDLLDKIEHMDLRIMARQLSRSDLGVSIEKHTVLLEVRAARNSWRGGTTTYWRVFQDDSPWNGRYRVRCLPQGHRRDIFKHILSKLRFKFYAEHAFSAQVNPDVARLLIWLSEQRGPSGISVGDLLNIKKLSLKKTVEYFIPELIDDALHGLEVFSGQDFGRPARH